MCWIESTVVSANKVRRWLCYLCSALASGPSKLTALCVVFTFCCIKPSRQKINKHKPLRRQVKELFPRRHLWHEIASCNQHLTSGRSLKMVITAWNWSCTVFHWSWWVNTGHKFSHLWCSRLHFWSWTQKWSCRSVSGIHMEAHQQILVASQLLGAAEWNVLSYQCSPNS